MKDSPKHMIFMASWLITSLAAINIGLSPFGINFFMSDWMMTRFPAFIMPIQYIVGIAGVICLITFIKACQGHCDCGKNSCPRCKS